MRIQRLHLKAYGPFTDKTLDFGDGRGLHLVLGQNEAGKSTTLRALGSLLFGYPREAEDTWRHNTRDILLGGRLVDAGGRELELYRRRSGANPLRDGGGAALAEGTLSAFLGNASRDLFERVFGLDHERLRRQAEAILADDGALGFSLVEAGAGITGIRGVLDKLRGDAEKLFVPRGRLQEINVSIARLTELRREARGSMVSLDRSRTLEKTLAEAEAALQSLQLELKRITVEKARCERIHRNQPRWARYQGLVGERAALDDVVALPATAAEERIQAEKALAVAESAARAAAGEIAALEQEAAQIRVDERVLGRHEEIGRLAELRGRVKGFEIDLPKRQAERKAQGEKVASLLREAGLPDGADLDRALPSAVQRKGVETLIAAGEKLVTQLASLEAAAAKAREKLAAAMHDRAGLRPARDVAGLAEMVASIERRGDLEARLGSDLRALERKRDALAKRLQRLALGASGIEELRALPLPLPETIERCRSDGERLAAELEEARRERTRLAADRKKKQRDMDELRGDGEVATLTALEQARERRDAAFALVRGLYIEGRAELAAQAAAIDPPRSAADAYERRVALADHAADALRADAERSAKYTLLVEQMSAVDELHKAASARGERLEAIALDAQRAWVEVARPAALHHLPPSEAAVVVERAEQILDEAEQLAGSEEALARERCALDEARSMIAGELRRQGLLDAAPDHPLATLLERARAFVKQHQAYAEAERRQQGLVAAAEREARDAGAALEGKQQELAQWKERWSAALEAVGLGGATAPEEASVFLEIVGKLEVERKGRAELRRRIERMEQDRGEFCALVDRIAGEIEAGAPAPSPLAASEDLERSLAHAKKAQVQLEALTKRIAERREALAAATARTEEHGAVLARLCRQAGAETALALPALEARSASKVNLDRQIAELKSEIVTDGGGLTVDELGRLCGEKDADALAAEVAELARKAEEVDALRLTRVDERAGLRRESEALEQSAQAGEKQQQAEYEAASLAERVERFASLAVSEALLRAALERYRERNQGPILARATRLFAALTDGAYAGLQTDVDDKSKPFVVAVRPDKSTLAVSDLSDGTVDQLYLALRLAVIEEHNANREPLPFIADDLLIHFDDRRATAALRTLAAIAEHGQVLFFTHHEHLRALARDAVPAPLLVEHTLVA